MQLQRVAPERLASECIVTECVSAFIEHCLRMARDCGIMALQLCTLCGWCSCRQQGSTQPCSAGTRDQYASRPHACLLMFVGTMRRARAARTSDRLRIRCRRSENV